MTHYTGCRGISVNLSTNKRWVPRESNIVFVRAETGVRHMDIDCIGAIGDHQEATVLSKQPAREYEPLPVVATTRREQRPAACLWDDMVWDEV